MIYRFEEYTYEVTENEHQAISYIVEILRTATAEEPVTNKEIRRRLPWFDDSNGTRIRKIIHHIRCSGEIPRLISSSKGYWPSDNPADIDGCIFGLDQRIKSIQEARDAIAAQSSGAALQRSLL